MTCTKNPEYFTFTHAWNKDRSEYSINDSIDRILLRIYTTLITILTNNIVNFVIVGINCWLFVGQKMFC